MHLCETCGKTFARTSELNRHRLTIHSKSKQSSCGLCGKTMRKDNLNQHMKTHRSQSRKEKRHLCDFCGTGFSLKTELVCDFFIKHGIFQPPTTTRTK